MPSLRCVIFSTLLEYRLLAGKTVLQIMTEVKTAGTSGLSEPQVLGAAAQLVQVGLHTQLEAIALCLLDKQRVLV